MAAPVQAVGDNMKRILIALSLVLLTLFAVSCMNIPSGESGQDINDSADAVSTGYAESPSPSAPKVAYDKDGAAPKANGKENDDNNEEKDKEPVDQFVLKAIFKRLQNNTLIVEVIESDYAFGTYIVHFSDTTPFETAQGYTITAEDLKEGDTLTITYGGQVMMSYPPQIVSQKIVKN